MNSSVKLHPLHPPPPRLARRGKTSQLGSKENVQEID